MPSGQLQLASDSISPGNPIAFLQSMRQSGDLSALGNWVWEAARNHGKLLLSAECFSEWFWHKPFIELSEKVDIHLLYYVRRQDEILLSAWRQWGLKRGMSLDAFINHRVEEKHPDYLSILWPWLNKISVKSFHINFIDKTFLGRKSLLEDAAEWLGVNFADMQAVENQNISIDARLLEFMSKRPQYFSSIHDDRILRLLSSAADTSQPQRLSLTDAQFSIIEKTFEGSNQALLEKFQPAFAGTPVLARESAPIQETPSWKDESEQLVYVKSCLQRLNNNPDQSLAMLRKDIEH